LRIDPKTNEVIEQLQIPGGGDMAIGEGSIWISVEDIQSLLRIDQRHSYRQNSFLR